MIVIKRLYIIIFLIILLIIALITQFYKEEIHQLIIVIKGLL